MMRTAIYEQIFKITEANMTSAGKIMPFEEDAFLYSASDKPNVADMAVISSFGKAAFLQAIYVSLLQRTPELEARLYWTNQEGLSNQEFQKKAFTSIANSEEFIQKQATINGNIYDEAGNRFVKFGMPSRTSGYYTEKLYLWFRRLPEPIKRILKLIAKRVCK